MANYDFKLDEKRKAVKKQIPAQNANIIEGTKIIHLKVYYKLLILKYK